MNIYQHILLILQGFCIYTNNRYWPIIFFVTIPSGFSIRVISVLYNEFKNVLSSPIS